MSASDNRTVTIGTRASLLATTQTGMVARAIEERYPTLRCSIVPITTSGDSKQGTAAARFGDKKDWVYELEVALLKGTIDLAVHSAKDVPPNIEVGTVVLPVLQREAPGDVFVGRNLEKSRIRFADLPLGASVGTASLRRRACLLSYRPDIRVVEWRGNVPTRLKKLDESTEIHGIVLAGAGVSRLGLLPPDAYEFLPPSIMLPAMNQGILAVQCREEDLMIREVASSLITAAELAVFEAERACTRVLGGSCNSSVSVYAMSHDGGTVTLEAWVLDKDGTTKLSTSTTGCIDDAVVIGTSAAQELLRRGAKQFL